MQTTNRNRPRTVASERGDLEPTADIACGQARHPLLQAEIRPGPQPGRPTAGRRSGPLAVEAVVDSLGCGRHASSLAVECFAII